VSRKGCIESTYRAAESRQLAREEGEPAGEAVQRVERAAESRKRTIEEDHRAEKATQKCT
jgi:hypothetical protein